eukprot:gene26764-35450_t
MAMANKTKNKEADTMIENISYAGLSKGQKLCREKEEGNREYKFKLTGLTDEQRNHRITQLNWRLNEGNDSAVYLIGVEDNGNQLGISDEELKESLRNLKYMADQVGCEMIVKQLFAGEQGVTAEIHMRRKTRLTVDTCQLNIATAGDLEAGKSTLIGVLCTGKLDNGKGLARTQVFRHNHEIETGRTSCISHHLLHFDDNGQVLNSESSTGCLGKGARLRALSDLELADESCRAVAMIDLAGHSKYLKTTLNGLVGRKLDYCMACIALINPPQQVPYQLDSMTIEHINISLYMDVPIFFAITKVDLLIPPAVRGAPAPPSPAINKDHPRVRDIITAISNFFVEEAALSNSQYDYSCVVVESHTQLVDVLMRMADTRRFGPLAADNADGKLERVIPIFLVSSVTGFGLDLLRSCLFQLPSSSSNKPQRKIMTTADSVVDTLEAGMQKDVLVRLLGTIARIDESSEEESTPEIVESTPKPRARQPSSRPSAKHCTTWSPPAVVDEPKGKASNSPELPPRVPSEASRLSPKTSLADMSTSPENKDRDSELNGLYHNKILIALVQRGELQCGQTLIFGPTSSLGSFETVKVASIRLNNVPIRFAAAGQTVTITLHPSHRRNLSLAGNEDVSVSEQEVLSPPTRAVSLDSVESSQVLGVAFGRKKGSTKSLLSCKSHNDSGSNSSGSLSFLPTTSSGVRRISVKGLVLLSAVKANAYSMFEAEVRILSSSTRKTTINVNYEPVVHVGCVNQSAKLISFVKILPQHEQEQLQRSSPICTEAEGCRCSNRRRQGNLQVQVSLFPGVS